MDELLTEIHTERAAYDGYGPWIVIRKDDTVAAYRAVRNLKNLNDASKTIVDATLLAETDLAEVEGVGEIKWDYQENDSAPSE